MSDTPDGNTRESLESCGADGGTFMGVAAELPPISALVTGHVCLSGSGLLIVAEADLSPRANAQRYHV
jgi:hypothetical protein